MTDDDHVSTPFCRDRQTEVFTTGMLTGHDAVGDVSRDALDDV